MSDHLLVQGKRLFSLFYYLFFSKFITLSFLAVNTAASPLRANRCIIAVLLLV